jgi:hypothetical protein
MIGILFLIFVFIVGFFGKHAKKIGHPFNELFKRK